MTNKRQQSNHSCQLIQVMMKTGKHAGKIVTILDVPGVVVRTGPVVMSMLPGLEGTGQVVGNAGEN